VHNIINFSFLILNWIWQVGKGSQVKSYFEIKSRIIFQMIRKGEPLKHLKTKKTSSELCETEIMKRVPVRKRAMELDRGLFFK
jgi:hypothetical protein